jgi:hypothetical protein
LGDSKKVKKKKWEKMEKKYSKLPQGEMGTTQFISDVLET